MPRTPPDRRAETLQPESRSRARRVVRPILGLLLAACSVVLAINSSWLAGPPDGELRLIAHRGVHQPFDRSGLDNDTCTAARWLPSGHRLLENTLPSMRAAFDAGADAVEIDVHRTADGQVAVFHDWSVDCRTEGSGRTRDHTLAELQALDVGHGYTTDGVAFPLRDGPGRGALPSLRQVLAAFPERAFHLDFKSNDVEDGEAVADLLDDLQVDASRLSASGGPRPVQAVVSRHPGLRSLTRPLLKTCLTRYAAVGWTGFVPEACRGGLVFVPANVGPWLWGWPHRFTRRMQAHGTEVVLLGPWTGGPSEGLDDPSLIPDDFVGSVWTNRIEDLGPTLHASRDVR